MYAEFKDYGKKYSPLHHLKIINRHSKILVFAFHNRCILKNLDVSLLKMNHLKFTEGVLKLNTSYDEEVLC